MLNCLISFNTSAFRMTAPACLCLSLLPSWGLFPRTLPHPIDIPNPLPLLFLLILLNHHLIPTPWLCPCQLFRTFHLLEDGPEDSKKGGCERACVSAAAGWSIRDEVDGLATAGPSRQKEITGIISEWLIDACRTSYACALAPSSSLSQSR